MKLSAQLGAIESLLILEDQILNLALKFDLQLPKAPATIVERLNSLSPQRLAAIQTNLGSLRDSFLQCELEKRDPWDDYEFFEISLRHLKMTCPRDFLDQVCRGDLVEGFDMNRMQIFRNLKYMQMINYSLMEIQAYDWPQLYDRAQMITDQMIGYCDEILWNGNRTIEFDIPKHFIRETRSKKKAMFEIQFRKLTPLYSGPNRPAGLIGTFTARALERSKSVDELSFI